MSNQLKPCKNMSYPYTLAVRSWDNQVRLQIRCASSGRAVTWSVSTVMGPENRWTMNVMSILGFFPAQHLWGHQESMQRVFFVSGVGNVHGNGMTTDRFKSTQVAEIKSQFQTARSFARSKVLRQRILRELRSSIHFNYEPSEPLNTLKWNDISPLTKVK